jgi:hypothetical protein
MKNQAKKPLQKKHNHQNKTKQNKSKCRLGKQQANKTHHHLQHQEQKKTHSLHNSIAPEGGIITYGMYLSPFHSSKTLIGPLGSITPSVPNNPNWSFGIHHPFIPQ